MHWLEAWPQRVFHVQRVCKFWRTVQQKQGVDNFNAGSFGCCYFLFWNKTCCLSQLATLSALDSYACVSQIPLLNLEVLAQSNPASGIGGRGRALSQDNSRELVSHGAAQRRKTCEQKKKYHKIHVLCFINFIAASNYTSIRIAVERKRLREHSNSFSWGGLLSLLLLHVQWCRWTQHAASWLWTLSELSPPSYPTQTEVSITILLSSINGSSGHPGLKYLYYSVIPCWYRSYLGEGREAHGEATVMHLAVKASQDFTTSYRHKLFFFSMSANKFRGKRVGSVFPARTHTACVVEL